MPSNRLDRLTSLRFVAAFIVVLTHGTLLIRDVSYDNALQRGDVTVSFFFILSGFVLTWTHVSGDSASGFWRRRVARVFPMQLATWALALLVLHVVFSRHESLKATVTSLFLLQAWDPNPRVYFAADGVAWSLSNEAFFYFLFPLVFWLLVKIDTRGRWLVAAVAVTIPVFIPLLTHVFPGQPKFWIVFICPLSRLPEFVLGMVLSLQFRDGWRPRLPLPATLAVAAVGVTLACVLPDPWWRVFPMVVPLALAIVIAADRDLRDLPGLLRHRWLVRLGTWSFAMYLVHPLVLFMIGRFWGPWHLPAGFGIELLIPAIAIPLAGLFHTYLEAPLERRLRGAPPRRDAIS